MAVSLRTELRLAVADVPVFRRVAVKLVGESTVQHASIISIDEKVQLLAAGGSNIALAVGGSVLIKHSLPKGEWHVVSATMDKFGTSTLYIGTEKISATKRITARASAFVRTENVCIGSCSPTAGLNHWVNGFLSDVFVWEGCLSLSDIISQSTSGLIAHWPMRNCGSSFPSNTSCASLDIRTGGEPRFDEDAGPSTLTLCDTVPVLRPTPHFKALPSLPVESSSAVVSPTTQEPDPHEMLPHKSVEVTLPAPSSIPESEPDDGGSLEGLECAESFILVDEHAPVSVSYAPSPPRETSDSVVATEVVHEVTTVDPVVPASEETVKLREELRKAQEELSSVRSELLGARHDVVALQAQVADKLSRETVVSSSELSWPEPDAVDTKFETEQYAIYRSQFRGVLRDVGTPPVSAAVPEQALKCLQTLPGAILADSTTANDIIASLEPCHDSALQESSRVIEKNIQAILRPFVDMPNLEKEMQHLWENYQQCASDLQEEEKIYSSSDEEVSLDQRKKALERMQELCANMVNVLDAAQTGLFELYKPWAGRPDCEAAVRIAMVDSKPQLAKQIDRARETIASLEETVAALDRQWGSVRLISETHQDGIEIERVNSNNELARLKLEYDSQLAILMNTIHKAKVQLRVQATNAAKKKALEESSHQTVKALWMQPLESMRCRLAAGHSAEKCIENAIERYEKIRDQDVHSGLSSAIGRFHLDFAKACDTADRVYSIAASTAKKRMEYVTRQLERIRAEKDHATDSLDQGRFDKLKTEETEFQTQQQVVQEEIAELTRTIEGTRDRRAKMMHEATSFTKVKVNIHSLTDRTSASQLDTLLPTVAAQIAELPSVVALQFMPKLLEAEARLQSTGVKTDILNQLIAKVLGV